jgi:FkbM family methyltransferase
MIEFLTSHCKDGDVIHAGAYFGDFLPALSQSCAPGAKIWAFEPSLENYRCALITSHINGLGNIELFHAALGERRESRTLVTTDAKGRSLGGGSKILGHEENLDTVRVDQPGFRPNFGLKVGDGSSRATETVQVVSVDELVPPNRKVSVIQLDVEEHEQEALSGALNTIKRCLPIIVVETLPAEDWLSENILQLGYRVDASRILGNVVLMRD